MICLIESLNFRFSSTSYMVFSPYMLEIYFVFTHYQTNSMAWNQFWKAKIRSVKDTRSILWKRQVHTMFTKARLHTVGNSKCSSTIRIKEKAVRFHTSMHSKVWISRPKRDRRGSHNQNWWVIRNTNGKCWGTYRLDVWINYYVMKKI